MERPKGKSTVAIDFGTSNTFISRCPPDSLQSTPVLLESGYLGIETAVLFRAEKRTMIGAQAVQTWGNEDPEKRKKMDLRLGFKPEIHLNEKARASAKEFFSGLLSYAGESRVPLTGENIDVYIGVPSNIGDNYKNTIKNIAREAGFANVRLKDEPVGALLYHLSIQDITPSETLGGVLIVDFGGGTCDFALMQELEVIDSWGDSMLGGRLFDDLFFQWLLEDNPQALEAMERDGAEFFIHWQRCRELKEAFSNFMSKHRDELWSGRVPYYGQIKEASWQDFLEKAQDYSPSEQFCSYLREMGRTEHTILEGKKINLIKWFENELKKVLTHHVAVEKVILCGGSSLWPFVPEVIDRALGLPRASILRSDNPYAVISQGLSLLPNLERRLQIAQGELKKDLPNLMENKIKKETIEPSIEYMVENLSQRVASFVVDEKIREKLLEFRETGGSISELENQLAVEMETSKDELGEVVNKEITEVLQRLQLKLSRDIKNWFISRGGIKPISIKAREEETRYQMKLRDLDIYEASLLGKMDILFKGISGIILFAVFSEAIIVTGPVGIVSGLIVALAVPFFGLRKSKEKIKQINLPKNVANKIFTRRMIDYTINKTREKMANEVKKELTDRMEEPKDKLLEEIKGTIEREIDSLSKLSAL